MTGRYQDSQLAIRLLSVGSGIFSFVLKTRTPDLALLADVGGETDGTKTYEEEGENHEKSKHLLLWEDQDQAELDHVEAEK